MSDELRRMMAESARRERRTWRIFGVGTAILVAVLVGLAWLAVSHENAREDRFMTQCVHDHKEYECTAMWRAGDRSIDIVPVPIIIPTGR